MKKITIFLLLTILAATLAFYGSALGDDVDFGGGDTGGGWAASPNWGDDDDGGNWGNTGGWGNEEDDFNTGGNGNSIIPIFAPLGMGSGGLNIAVILIIVVVIFILYAKQNRRGTGMRPQGSTKRIDQASLDALAKQDSGFSAADIETKVKNWVMQFEMAWANGDMTPCRPFLSDGLYNTYQMQLNMMKQNGEASRTEDLAVMMCELEKWTVDGNNEYLDVWLQEKKRTYKVDANNPSNVIKGDRQTVYILEYRWQLIRSAGGKTENAGVKVMECPNCGAQTSVNQSGKCDYCGSTIVTDSFDWVLNKADKLAQTSHK